MSKFKTLTFVSLVALIGAGSALAGPGQKPGQGNQKPISFDELKERCLHPRDFDVQIPPQNIKIQCTDQRTTWMAAQPGEVELPSQRTVISGVFADKFFVNAEQSQVPIMSKAGSCHRFKEVEETVTLELPLTCDQILGIKSSLAEFCTSQLDLAKGANPKLIETQETGNVIDTCGGGAQQNGGKGPK
jgi:hypothetical protein